MATIVNGQLDVAGIEGNFDGKVRNGQIACDIAPPANGTGSIDIAVQNGAIDLKGF